MPALKPAIPLKLSIKDFRDFNDISAPKAPSVSKAHTPKNRQKTYTKPPLGKHLQQNADIMELT